MAVRQRHPTPSSRQRLDAVMTAASNGIYRLKPAATYAARLVVGFVRRCCSSFHAPPTSVVLSPLLLSSSPARRSNNIRRFIMLHNRGPVVLLVTSLACLVSSHLLIFRGANLLSYLQMTDMLSLTAPTPLTYSTKYILYATTFWGIDDFQFGMGHEPFLEYACPVHQCYATSNQSLLINLTDFDAVLFHAVVWDIEKIQLPLEWRQPHQLFVMMMMECPLNEHDKIDYEKYAGFFNATMTYRRDSDFPRPYGRFHARKSQTMGNEWSFLSTSVKSDQEWIPYDEQHFITRVLPKKNETFRSLARRPKKVAWIVSRCDTPSKRDDYVRELQQYISVDVFGKCGTTPCDEVYKEEQADNCTLAVRREYKFYLSFENSLCNDYVTEKFFDRVSTNVVIVLGQANYSEIAPPHSYINVMDYKSPEELANYLHYLDRNESAYLSYFWWQDHYEVRAASLSHYAQTMCQLCERLHSKDATKLSTSYVNMVEWWREKAECNRDMPALSNKSIMVANST